MKRVSTKGITTPPMWPDRKTSVIHWRELPGSKSWYCQGQSESAHIPTAPKVSRMNARVPEHSYLFLIAATAKMSYAQRFSRNTSEIMWSAGLIGHRGMDLASSAWRTLFSSRGVLWSLRGLPLHSLVALGQRKFP